MKYFFYVSVLIFSFIMFSCGDNFERDKLAVVDNSVKTDNAVKADNDVFNVVDNEVQDENSPVCGNGVVENGETCDKNSKNCSDILGSTYEGTASCKSDCSGFDTSSCQQKQTKTVYKVIRNRCRGCARCIRPCKYDAIQMVGGYAVIDPKKCTGCGDCAAACPFGAIEKTTY